MDNFVQPPFHMRPLNNAKVQRSSKMKFVLYCILLLVSFYLVFLIIKRPQKKDPQSFDYDKEKTGQIESQNKDSLDSLEDALNATASETLDQ